MCKVWYVSKSGTDQGLVLDEETGETIAVTYKAENASIVAAAPELLAACKLALTAVADPHEWNTKARPALMSAIAKFNGE